MNGGPKIGQISGANEAIPRVSSRIHGIIIVLINNELYIYRTRRRIHQKSKCGHAFHKHTMKGFLRDYQSHA